MDHNFSTYFDRLAAIAAKPLPSDCDGRKKVRDEIEEIAAQTLALDHLSIVPNNVSDLIGRICGHMVEAFGDSSDWNKYREQIGWANQDIRILGMRLAPNFER